MLHANNENLKQLFYTIFDLWRWASKDRNMQE
jgi:hypothetical protein